MSPDKRSKYLVTWVCGEIRRASREGRLLAPWNEPKGARDWTRVKHKEWLANKHNNTTSNLESRDNPKSTCLRTCRCTGGESAAQALLDSPLNKAGKLLIYMHTDKNVLIEAPALRPTGRVSRVCGWGEP